MNDHLHQYNFVKPLKNSILGIVHQKILILRKLTVFIFNRNADGGAAENYNNIFIPE